jgi:DNA-binding GntR family transcriptional regulator
MFLRVHQFDEIVPYKAAGCQYSSSYPTHLMLLLGAVYVYCIQYPQKAQGPGSTIHAFAASPDTVYKKTERYGRESAMALKTIKLERKRLADAVYDQLLEAIRDGEIADDERLVQEKLAEQLQISRTPVREALLRLEQDGILVSSPRGGFALYRMNQDEVRELYQARAAIEGQAVRILASRNDKAINARLREIIRREENISSSKVSDYFNANRTIHRSMVELTGNRYLLEMFDNIWNRATSYNLFATIEKLDLAKSLGDHLRLVEAIESGSPTVAMEAIVDHIQHGFDLQIEALEK